MIAEMNVKDYKSSLHAFVELICVQTNYDSDEVPLTLFADNYEKFCNIFQLELMNYDPLLLKKEFNMDHSKKKVHYLERINKTSDLNPKGGSNQKYY